ncbi:MAG: sulfotransferase [Fulvivirga sp.]
MKEKLFLVGKKLLGKKLYNDLRARHLFRDFKSPFPLYKSDPYEIDWSSYTKVHKSHSIPVTYIISPTQRSGTNFLSQVLNKHPKLEFPTGDNMPDEHCLYSYSKFLKDYSSTTVSTWSKWLKGDSKKIDASSKALMHSLGYGLLSYLRRYIEEESILLLKTPDAGNIESVFHLFPNAKVILLVRDGRDTIESFSKSWGGDGAFKNMCKRWDDRVKQIIKFREQADASDKKDDYLIVKYDELNDNTSTQVAKILEFLHLDQESFPWDELSDVPILGSSTTKNNDDHVHWDPVKKDQTFSPNKKWGLWSNRKKNIFKKYAGKSLIDLGFAEDNSW